MSDYISKKDREYVGARSKGRCEYCLMPQRFVLFAFHVDHVISLKHGGQTVIENLALACGTCNSNKGTDLGTVIGESDAIVRFFNPRKDNWEEHFEVYDGVIYAKTSIGQATIKIFRFNDIERILERKLLIEGGFWH